LFADSKVGFLISGEKSNGCFALARAPAMGTKLASTNDRSMVDRFSER
jgi:hypothetical protein